MNLPVDIETRRQIRLECPVCSETFGFKDAILAVADLGSHVDNEHPGSKLHWTPSMSVLWVVVPGEAVRSAT